jgi:hypothetical protein
MRFIDEPRSECPRDESIPRYVVRPRFRKRPCKREQHWTPRERDHHACVTHHTPTGVHDECLRRQQRFDLLEQEGSLLAIRNQTRCRRVQDERCTVDLRHQRWNAGFARSTLGPDERGTGRLGAEASYRNPRDDQLVGGPRRGWKERGVEPGERTLGFIEVSDQEKTPGREIPRVRGVDAVTVGFERHPRGVKRLHGPAQVA